MYNSRSILYFCWFIGYTQKLKALNALHYVRCFTKIYLEHTICISISDDMFDIFINVPNFTGFCNRKIWYCLCKDELISLGWILRSLMCRICVWQKQRLNNTSSNCYSRIYSILFKFQSIAFLINKWIYHYKPGILSSSPLRLGLVSNKKYFLLLFNIW